MGPSGTLVASTYAALELVVSGPFNVSPEESIGSWYMGTIVPYVLVFVVLGALTGVVLRFVLARTGHRRHHVLPTLSAVLMVVFVGNAWRFGFGLLRTFFSRCCCRWPCGC